MRKLPGLLGAALLLSSLGQAQTGKDTTQPATCLFDHFTGGTVKMKNGALESTLLNYDTENQTILFRQGGQNLVLTGMDNIDTVYLQDKRFIPAEDKFYEVGTSTPIALLISYTYKTHPLTATTDHDGTVQKDNNQVSNNVSEAYTNRRFQGHYSVTFTPHYWLRIGHSFYKANTEKEVIKVFPRKEAAIREFTAANKVVFGRPDDMIKLILFCNEHP